MDKDSLERIRNLTKNKITVSNFQKEQCMSNKNRRLNMKKMASVACICLILTSGIVFAKDIEKFVKQAKGISEECKIALRNIRQDANNDIKKLEMPEDTKKGATEDVQELINKYNKIVDEKLKIKEQELMTV